MANNIMSAKKFIPLLDEVYRSVSLTAKLDGAADLARQGANANELIIPMIELQGLGNYDRNGGYVSGEVRMVNETVRCNFDRGRMFTVDNMDNAETAGLAFGRLAGEFIRTKVVPELDAFRFASYCAKEGIGKKEETFSNGAAVLTALRAASNAMDEAEVPMEDRHLFITPTLDGMIADLDTNKSREILARFASKTLVPQTRFYTKIDQKDGHTGGQEDGGYTKNSQGRDINFMVIHKPALIQFEKHVVPKIVTPDQNQQADAYKYGYRNVGVADVYKNKAAGVYVSHKPVG